MMKIRKNVCALALATCMIVSLAAGLFKPATHVQAAPLTGLTAREVVDMMGTGFNMGNSFDATGGRGSIANIYAQEISWGNPRITEEQILAIKDAGFDTIRIPVTWNNYIDKNNNYAIKAEFLARVKEVVDYAYNAGLFIILNVHHEEWVNRADLDKSYTEVGVELKAVWEQLADYFADYDQHLIFEGMNEPRMANTRYEWNGGTKEARQGINYLLQIFVDAVRSNHKGYNDERALMLPGYAASNSKTVLADIKIPEIDGKEADNVIISIHGYTPYEFSLGNGMTEFDTSKTSCTSDIDMMFKTAFNMFVSKGIPVVLGETGATDKGNTASREAWAYYISSQAAKYGIPVVLWDNGSRGTTGTEHHEYLDRQNAQWLYPTIVSALIEGRKSVDWACELKSVEQMANKTGVTGGKVFWSDNNGKTSDKEWDYTYIQLGSEKDFYRVEGGIAVAYTGSGEPKIVLDSETLQQWWIPIDADKIEDVADKRVAFFSTESIIREMNKYGVEDVSDLRYFSILAANGNITTYEISYLPGTGTIAGKPAPTATPVPTATPAPTATPVPTATPTTAPSTSGNAAGTSDASSTTGSTGTSSAGDYDIDPGFSRTPISPVVYVIIVIVAVAIIAGIAVAVVKKRKK